jgi:hypothetical protein
MNRRTRKHKEAQSAVLARMAATRAELVCIGQLAKSAAGENRPARQISPNVGPIFLRTPNAALLALMLVGAVVSGPRQILVTSFRAGLTAWITKTAQAFVNGQI